MQFKQDEENQASSLVIIDGQSVCCSSTSKLGGQANKEYSVWI